MLFAAGGTFAENLKMALSTLRTNKLRSALTIVGVIIGVVTVMLISSIISGIQVGFEREIESYGTRSIFLYKMDIGLRSGQPTREERMRKPLTMDDAGAIGALSSVEVAVPFLDISNSFFGQKILVTGKNGKTTSAIQLSGTVPDIEKADTEVLIDGRWFSQSESDDKAKVCVIGASVVDNYFQYENPIGNTLEIGGHEFTVIGTLEKREQMMGGHGGNDDQSNVIYMPMGAALRLKPFADDLFILAVAKPDQMSSAKNQIEDLLRIRRKVPLGEPNNFGMETAAGMIDQFNSIFAMTFLAMVVISSIGLLIGGIGVMNIMLVSVTERTREIGIRKAIGAKRTDILLQFLIEAATLTGLGGLIGLAIGWLLTFLVKLILPSYVPAWAPIAGFCASVGIGLVFGLFPAWKAARLDPIESLRYE